MKTVTAIAALACGLAMTTAASAADIRFRGAITITDAKNCAAHQTGAIYNSAYMAAGSDGGHILTTSFSMVGKYGGDIYELETGEPFPKTWTTLLGYGFDGGDYFFSTKVRMTMQKPAVVDDKTQALDLVGSIQTPGNDPGVAGVACVINFRASYNRKLG